MFFGMHASWSYRKRIFSENFLVWKFSILFGNFENRNFEKFYLKNIFEKRVMKNVTQKVLCSNFFENKYFFIKTKVKVAPTHGLSKTSKNIENGWKLAKLSRFFVRSSKYFSKISLMWLAFESCSSHLIRNAALLSP